MYTKTLSVIYVPLIILFTIYKFYMVVMYMICDYFDICKKITYVCFNEYKYFLSKENVIGLGLGFQVKNGFYTNKKCIKVLVSNKVAPNNLCTKDLIPKCYKGIPTDVWEIGTPYLQSLTKKVRPTVCGYSIGPEAFPKGVTLGCIVTDGRNRFILSCNHGIVNAVLPTGAKILQPAIEDGGRFPTDHIGAIRRYVPLKPKIQSQEPQNPVDCCIISVTNPSIISTEVYGIGKLQGVQTAKLQQPVVKVGRSTEITTGKVLVLNTTVLARFNDKQYLLTDQIITTPMTQPGDSGAILLGNGNLALGLVSGGSSSTSFSNSIANVLESLEVNIVTN